MLDAAAAENVVAVTIVNLAFPVIALPGMVLLAVNALPPLPYRYPVRPDSVRPLNVGELLDPTF